MKATGIVRKIDELGRIVIPKEMRKTMRIKEGEALEIYIGNNRWSDIKKIWSYVGAKRTYWELCWNFVRRNRVNSSCDR